MTNPLTVFIGYDSREEDAYQVCVSSLQRHTSIPLHIVKMDLTKIKTAKLYTRPYKTTDGQMVDTRDGRPFSTEFSFSRFLVPALSLYNGWALFVDCDFLFTDDVAELLPFLDENYAVMAVQHDYVPAEAVKMDGVSQGVYGRKNWSSFVLWNCGHPLNRELTIKTVNTKPGKWLHGFEWLEDDKIGALPKSWNWLSGVSEQLDEVPSAIHFTLGVPSMKGHENSPYADLWRDELNRSAIKENKDEKRPLFRHYGSKQYADRAGSR